MIWLSVCWIICSSQRALWNRSPSTLSIGVFPTACAKKTLCMAAGVTCARLARSSSSRPDLIRPHEMPTLLHTYCKTHGCQRYALLSKSWSATNIMLWYDVWVHDNDNYIYIYMFKENTKHIKVASLITYWWIIKILMEWTFTPILYPSKYYISVISQH